MDWLDKLEKRLRKSPKSAADAEEISEELDVRTYSIPILVWVLLCDGNISSPVLYIRLYWI